MRSATICRPFAVLGVLMILIHIESSFIPASGPGVVPAGTALSATLRVVKTHRPYFCLNFTI
jgi:hypothetical protein